MFFAEYKNKHCDSSDPRQCNYDQHRTVTAHKWKRSRHVGVQFAVVVFRQERSHLKVHVSKFVRAAAVRMNQIIGELVNAWLQSHVIKLVSVLAVRKCGDTLDA